MRIVIKCGGRGDLDLDAVASEVARLREDGAEVVVVHGGSASIDAMADALGVERRRLTAPDGTVTRYTDADTMRAVLLGLLGEAKPALLRALLAAGVRAVSMSGADAGLVRARRKSAVRAVVDGRQVVVRDNLAGRITDVDDDLLRSLLDLGLVPLLSPPAVAHDGELVNVDADRLAAAVAGAVGADRLVLLTSAPGLLADPADEASTIAVLDADALTSPTSVLGAKGGMRMKLVAVAEALEAGVQQVHVADGRVATPVTAALQGAGTVVTRDAGAERRCSA